MGVCLRVEKLKTPCQKIHTVKDFKDKSRTPDKGQNRKLQLPALLGVQDSTSSQIQSSTTASWAKACLPLCRWAVPKAEAAEAHAPAQANSRPLQLYTSPRYLSRKATQSSPQGMRSSWDWWYLLTLLQTAYPSLPAFLKSWNLTSESESQQPHLPQVLEKALMSLMQKTKTKKPTTKNIGCLWRYQRLAVDKLLLPPPTCKQVCTDTGWQNNLLSTGKSSHSSTQAPVYTAHVTLCSESKTQLERLNKLQFTKHTLFGHPERRKRCTLRAKAVGICSEFIITSEEMTVSEKQLYLFSSTDVTNNKRPMQYHNQQQCALTREGWGYSPPIRPKSARGHLEILISHSKKSILIPPNHNRFQVQYTLHTSPLLKNTKHSRAHCQKSVTFMCPEPPPAQQQDGGHWQQQLPTEALTSPYRAAFEHVPFAYIWSPISFLTYFNLRCLHLMHSLHTPEKAFSLLHHSSLRYRGLQATSTFCSPDKVTQVWWKC